MNALLVATAIAINPALAGPWCDSTTQEPVVGIYDYAYADLSGGYRCAYDDTVKATARSFEATTLNCYEIGKEKPSDASPLTLDVKYTLTGDRLTEWYVDRTGKAAPKRVLILCPNDAEAEDVGADY